MKAVVLFILIVVAACQLPFTDIIHPDQYNPKSIVMDTGGIMPPDTSQISFIDTCFQLVHIDTPAFTMLSTYFFNGAPLTPEWHYDQFSMAFDSLPDLMEFLYPQYEYTYYEGNGGVSLIADGISSSSFLQAKIWTRDAIGQKAFLTTCNRCLNFYGSATPEEANMASAKRPSTRSFHFFNTDDWTPVEENTFAETTLHAELCKHGQYWANFTDSEVRQSLQDSFEFVFLWENVFQNYWLDLYAIK